MKLNVLKFLLVVVGVCCWQTLQAQVYPVQVNTQLLPPFTPFLSDLNMPGAQKFMVQLRVNDPTLSELPCKLRLTIEGVGITIRTKPTFNPEPLRLQGGGIPETFYGEDLIAYFNVNNLDFAGYSRREYEKGAKLPEGVYRFSIEVLDYNKSNVISNKGTAMAWIILNDPPLLNMPRKETKVQIIDPTNIAFTWTPRHTGSPNAAFNTEYVFRLVEIWPLNRNPYDAFLTQQPLFETTTDKTQIVYGPAEPALIPGRKYAWQVQAMDIDKRDLFKNQGRSEVFVFQFGDAIGAPENVRSEGGNEYTITLRWEPPVQGDMPDKYRIRYRPIFSDNWYETVTDQRWGTVPSLKPSTEYDIQIRSEKQHQVSEYTAVQRYRTEAKSEKQFTCDGEPDIPPIHNTEPLVELRQGEEIRCSDFTIIVLTINPGWGNGNFSGTGMLPVHLFNNAKIGVTFSGHINNNHEMTSGGFETIYNPGSKIAQAVDKMKEIGKDKPALSEGDSSTQVTPSTPVEITITGVIDSVYFNAETKEIVVVDAQGKETTHKQPIDEKTKQPVVATVADSAGNSYTVDKDGKVTKSESAPATNTIAVSSESIEIIKETVKALRMEFSDNKLSDLKSELDEKASALSQHIATTRKTLVPEMTTGTGDAGTVSSNTVPLQNQISSATEFDRLSTSYADAEYFNAIGNVVKWIADDLDNKTMLSDLARRIQIGGKNIEDYLQEQKKKGTAKSEIQNEIKIAIVGFVTKTVYEKL
jgi:hypothetical protein